MKNGVICFTMLLFISILFIACSDDETSTTSSLELNISGLEDLGTSFAYEGWLIVNGSPVTTGTFSVSSDGTLSKTSFIVQSSDLESATTFVLTVEPSPDSDPAPTNTHILAGDFVNNNSNLSVSHSAALNNSFESISGKYILATPTNGMNNNENSGIWFLDLSSGAPEVGLVVPTLPNGWTYEGWAVINGIPVTTGTFSSASGIDNAAPFSGTMGGPPFPGEDFLNSAPSGLSFPTDISGGVAVISIEPVPDNSSSPFLLKPLVGQIPQSALDHTVYDMDKNLSFPTGTVTR